MTFPPTLLPGLASHPWAYPALEVAHIVGVALLLGNLTLLELRVWGLGRALPLATLARMTLTLVLAGATLAVTSGLLMFASQSGDLVGNRVFIAKMGLLLLLACNAVVFHARSGLARLDAIARAQTALSLGLWVLVIVCGRWIAYS